jgi:hypothetical protein
LQRGHDVLLAIETDRDTLIPSRVQYASAGFDRVGTGGDRAISDRVSIDLDDELCGDCDASCGQADWIGDFGRREGDSR